MTLLLGPVHFQPTGPAEDQTQKLILSTAIIAIGSVLERIKGMVPFILLSRYN